MNSRLFFGASSAVVLACSLLTGGPVLAQKYPEKPVRMIVPFPAGGPLDVVARVFSIKLSEHSGNSFLVDNRPGAAGNIGMDMVAKAAPDGYTVLWAIDAMLTVNPILYKKMGDPLDVLRPVTMLAESVSTLAVHPSMDVRTPADFAALSKTRDLSYGSAGSGSPGHRSMELFKLLSGARLTHVPYKGNAPAVQSLVAGETQAFITPIAGVLQHVRAGKVRALAVTSARRSSVLPDVPTMIELGYPKFKVVAWYSVLVPQKTPQPIVDALDREIVRIIQLPDVRQKLAGVGVEPVWDSGKAVAPRAREERALWAEVIEKSGMKID
jgi:tripartite-type tricarboxylate transporter receptor subunit TctC